MGWVILQDNSFVGKRTGADQRPVLRRDGGVLRERQIHDGQHFSSSSIAVSVGDRDYNVDFRGSDKARHTHEIILCISPDRCCSGSATREFVLAEATGPAASEQVVSRAALRCGLFEDAGVKGRRKARSGCG